jgi:hypothetical protein
VVSLQSLLEIHLPRRDRRIQDGVKEIDRARGKAMMERSPPERRFGFERGALEVERQGWHGVVSYEGHGVASRT